jgi:hypothetical protein
MVKNIEFVRNIYANDLLEVFLISSVSSLLVVRFILSLTGYPQLGGGTLHIAHMLWGGLIMMVSLVFLLAFLGNRVLWASAIIGGIGFGVFLDELGKFVTRDNNYLFQPTVAILYIIFLLLFFVFRYIDDHSKMSQKEYLMNALRLLEEAVMNDMDKAEKRQFAALLRRADQDDEVTIQLKKLLENIDIIPTQPSRVRRIYRLFSKFYRRVTASPLFPRGIIIFFMGKTLLDIISVSIFLMTYFSDPTRLFLSTPSSLAIVTWGQVISTIAATALVVMGVVTLKFSRDRAYFFFKQSLLITIFLTQFFLFYKEQFHALTGLTFNVLLLIGLEYMMNEENQLKLSEK